MYKKIKGNIFNSSAQVLVNTVNCVGVMGRGIALECKLRFPEMYKNYKKFCDQKKIQPGILQIWKDSSPWILNFPTKSDWRDPSKFEYLEKGFFNDNWRINVNKKLIHAEALNLSGNIKETLSNIASLKDGVAICNFFIYGKKLLSYENNLRENLKNSETVLLSHSKWNDKILVRMVAKDAYDLKSIQKNLISILADDNIPKVWNS